MRMTSAPAWRARVVWGSPNPVTTITRGRPDDRVAGKIGQAEIADKDVEVLPGRALDGGASAGGGHHGEALRGEQHCKNLSHVVHVFDEKYPQTLTGHHPGLRRYRE
jgi:hypothetical protein